MPVASKKLKRHHYRLQHLNVTSKCMDKQFYAIVKRYIRYSNCPSLVLAHALNLNHHRSTFNPGPMVTVRRSTAKQHSATCIFSTVECRQVNLESNHFWIMW